MYYIINKLNFQDSNRSIFIQFIKDNFIDKKNKPFKNKYITQGINNLLDNKTLNKKSLLGYDIDEIINESYTNKKLDFKKLMNNLLEKNYIRQSDKEKLKHITDIIN